MLHETAPGAKAWWKGKSGTVTVVTSMSQVGFLVDGEDHPRAVSIYELENAPPPVPAPPALGALKPWQLEIAYKRYDVLKPFLDRSKVAKGLKEAVASAPKEARLGLSTAYRLVHNWSAYPELAALAPGISNGGKGKSRLDHPRIDEAIEACILKHYAVRSEPTARSVYEDHLPSFCRAIDCPVPSYDIFIRRIRAMAPDIIAKGRKGSRHARRLFGLNRGPNPLSTGPLECVQMDFWDVHVILVDAETREPIGRPYLSLASCTTTRMTYGYYLSFDPPSAATAAWTILRGAMQKHDLLKRLDIEEEWPVWGFPKILHVDNALEYRGNVLKSLAMQEGGFEIMHRPVRTPHFGGSIENRFKVLATKLYHSPGSTGFNPMSRPEAKAVQPVYTIDEFERFLVNLLIEHANTSSPTFSGRTPLQVWNSFFFDKSGKQIAPLLPSPRNPERLLIQCCPFQHASLRSSGLVWDYMQYDNPDLTALKKHPDIAGKATKLEMRRDPRDITTIWVLNPITKEYFQVQAAGRYDEPIPLWEWRQSLNSVDIEDRSEDVINRCRERRKRIEQDAKVATKTQKRNKVRAKNGLHQKDADHTLATGRRNPASRGGDEMEPIVESENVSLNPEELPHLRFRNLAVLR